MNTENILTYIPLSEVGQMLDSYAKATGMALWLTDPKGAIVLEVYNASGLSLLLRKGSDIVARTMESYQNDVSKKAITSKKYATVTCGNSVVKVAVPIVVDGACVALIVGGDVFGKEISSAQLEQDCANLALDKNAYVAAAKNVEIVTTEKVDNFCEMMQVSMSTFFSMVKEKNREFTTNYNGNSNEIIANHIIDINKKLEQNVVKSHEIFENVEKVYQLIAETTGQIDEAKDNVQSIQNVAMNTRILGFNASIEASHAKESGRGFGVIAQEVRSLADVSKASVDTIESRITSIDENSTQIQKLLNATTSTFRGFNQSSVEISDLFKEIVDLVQ